MRTFVQLAMEKGYDYYLMEAYDQPWKNANEGAVGAYWGLFDAMGAPKFPSPACCGPSPNGAAMPAARRF